MSVIVTALDLDAIEARANAATRGPWITGVRWEDPVDNYWLPINRPSSDPEDPHQPDRIALIRYETCGFQYPHFEALSDAAFIANARQDVPALVAEVRRLRAALTQIADMCECRRGDLCGSAVAHYALHGRDTE